MKTLSKISSLFLATSMVITLVSCVTPPTTVPQGAGTEKASITGTMTMKDGTPAKNKLTVLIQHANDTTNDIKYVTTKDQGEYSFTSVPAGDYRVAFDVSPQAQREKGEKVFYDPATDTSKFYNWVSTNKFSYDGKSGATFQVPAFNVEWNADLRPFRDTDEFSADKVEFSWSEAYKADHYQINIKDTLNNTVFTKNDIKELKYTWDGKKTDGTQVTSGVYYYSIGVYFKVDENVKASIMSAGSALAKFKIK